MNKSRDSEAMKVQKGGALAEEAPLASSSSSSYTPLPKAKEMRSECRHEDIKDMFIAQDQKDVCAFIKAHILKRPHLRSRFKHPSLNRRGGAGGGREAGEKGASRGEGARRLPPGIFAEHKRGGGTLLLRKNCPAGPPEGCRGARIFLALFLSKEPLFSFLREKGLKCCVYADSGVVTFQSCFSL